MRLLLDTHIIVWELNGDQRLKQSIRDAIDEADDVAVSAIAILEIAIKRRQRKLEAPDDLLTRLPGLGCRVLQVKAEHAWAVGDLPSIHGDPFDRLMAAQAKIEGLTLVTADHLLQRYDVEIMLA